LGESRLALRFEGDVGKLPLVTAPVKVCKCNLAIFSAIEASTTVAAKATRKISIGDEF
jgi:hypothetical protein